METRRKILILYIPVIHKGYIKAIKQESFSQINVLGKELLDELMKHGLDYLDRDIRTLDPYEIVSALEALFPKVSIGTISEAELKRLVEQSNLEIYFTYDEIGEKLHSLYLQNSPAQVRYVETFLRWGKLISQQELMVPPDRVISELEADQNFMNVAVEEAKKSSDWWRHVGCALVTDSGITITRHNKHLPHEHIPYVEGDVRSNFNAGERNDLGTAIHAEASAIAHAARAGIALAGARVYVTTFPCQACARLIRESGIRKVFYRYGYSVQDAERIFKDAGIEIVLVK